jgi:hypothetical protein
MKSCGATKRCVSEVDGLEHLLANNGRIHFFESRYRLKFSVGLQGMVTQQPNAIIPDDLLAR